MNGEGATARIKLVSSEIGPALLLSWQVAQFAALVIAGLRAPLAAAYPQPPESEAVRVLLACQFAWSAILLPALGGGWATSLVMAASGWVMLVVAAALAGWPMAAVVPPGVFLTLWIACLAMWAHALPWRPWRLVASAIGTSYSVGGIFVWYVGIDLGTRLNLGAGVRFGPLFVLLDAPRHPAPGGWVLLIVMLVAALATSAISPTFRPSPLGS